MKKLILFYFLISPCFIFSQYRLDGKVFNKESNEPLIGATVYIDNSFNAGYSDAEGSFRLNKILENNIDLIVSYIGFKTDTISIDLNVDEDVVVYLTPKPYQTDEVIILGTRVTKNAPATQSNVSKADIEDINLGQDLPYLLQQTPSVVATSDAGAGIGYTGIRIRGSDASRINVTINGIPLNDAESHGVFWVNMPDFASSLESVQIQRGVGTSTNGAGAFGATINLETNTLAKKAYGEINNAIGSFASRKHTVKFGSGLINDHFAFEGRLSNIQSDGYVNRASSDLQSYFLSGTYYADKTVLKAITFGGKEVTYQSWYGTPESVINGNQQEIRDHYNRNIGTLYNNKQDSLNLFNSDRRFNYYLYENQVDNYNQDHYQLHLSHQFSDKLTVNAALHYTKGEGYFEEFKGDEEFADYNIALDTIFSNNDTITSTDLIRRRWLDNDFYGFTYSVLYNPNNKLNFVLGGGINNYEGDHFGQVIWAEYANNNLPTRNYYFNEAEKLDANTYLKTSYQFNKQLGLFADLQVRRIEYSTKGTDNDLRNIDVDEDFTFFNPKIGLNYEFNPNTSFYTLLAIGNREPNRADFIDQPANTPKKDANKAERMYNAELGVENIGDNYKIAINTYLMYYENQLVNTGQLNDVGSSLRQNVDESYRLGIELQGGYIFNKYFSWNGNLTLSENKIMDFNELTYDYTVDFDIISNKKSNTDIALSPSVIANSELTFSPFKDLEVALLSRYVGEQFLDNTSNRSRMLDAYVVNDLRLEYKVPFKLVSEMKIQLLVNNIFSEKYSANGYTYTYISGQSITENFYYPQALRNYLVGLNIKF